MRDLYDHLQRSRQPERQATAERLITDLQAEPKAAVRAGEAYYSLCQTILQSMGIDEPNPPYRIPRGIFQPYESARLVTRIPRTQGFLHAIQRSTDVHRAIDAGTGASAILAVGTTVAHPRAEVDAYELNEEAFLCAQALVALLGLQGRITVHHADVLKAPLGRYDLAVTETFSSGLLNEFGHRITPVLASHLTENGKLLPRFAVLYASDQYKGYSDAPWQEAAVLDLSLPHSSVTGRIQSTRKGTRQIGAYVGFYDTEGDAVIDTAGADYITTPLHIGEQKVPKRHTPISFSYELGVPFHQSHPRVWSE